MNLFYSILNFLIISVIGININEMKNMKINYIVEPINMFDELVCNFPGELQVIHADSCYIKIIGENAFFNKLKINQFNHRLSLSIPDSIKENIRVIVSTCSKLKYIQLNGKIKMFLDDVVLEDCLTIEATGMSNLILRNLNLNSLSIKSNGLAKIEGSGNVQNLNLTNNGLAKIFFGNLLSNHVKCFNSGMGEIYVKTLKSFNGKSEGMGTIYCYGEPEEYHVTKSGFGRIIKE